MKRTAGTLYLITVSLLLAACDPGMTIRQIKASRGTSDPVTIEVKTEHPLIGHTFYAPHVTVINGSDSSITITSVELAAKRGTYPNKPRRPGSYPSAVPPGRTETLDIWFDLTDDVKKTFFQQPAELRVHYLSRGRDEIANVSVIGGHLDISAP
ncbi:MAG TPA: hypothetical protein VNN81_06295 [Bradyrhizobium sp.]|nr:hypothetical protein [Bradyrhizobium sp.]